MGAAAAHCLPSNEPAACARQTALAEFASNGDEEALSRSEPLAVREKA